MSRHISHHNDGVSHNNEIDYRRKVIKSFKAKADAKRTGPEKFADFLTLKFGSVLFLSLNAAWFFVWIIMNTRIIPGLKPFDPFPFGLLTMIVSLEAIFLAIIVLISQNRGAKVDELREEIELQLNTMSEGEVTKLIKMTSMLLKKQGINVANDSELKEMLKPFNPDKVEKQIQNELDK